jgi:alpha-2-macroglobulin
MARKIPFLFCCVSTKNMKKIVSYLLVCTIYFGMISPIIVRVNAQKTSGKTSNNMNQITPEGFQFRLSEGVEGAENREKPAPATGDPLSESETGKLLKRIPEIKTQTDDQTDFAKRIGTLPPPKTGDKIPVKFPSDEQRNPPTYDNGKIALEVVRFTPEGEVKLAPDLSVTFSQAMVAVTSQEEAAAYAPVQITPAVEGKWRWLGTKTLMFDTTKRFPMATRFSVKIPAGTKSATGQVLQKDFNWTFTTPPPKVETFIPNSQITKRDALMFLSFDQAINPAEILKTLKVSGGGKVLPIRFATQAEIDADSSISYYAKQSQPNRWLAFRAITNEGLTENALPGASAISVVVEKGTASAEGPLKTTEAQSFGFQTYSAFKFNAGYCGWRENKNCSPFESWNMEFNNSIDAATFTKEMVKIEPAVEGLNIFPSGNYITISGYKKGSTTYKITVDGALKDNYGQTLGKPAVATIRVGKAEQNLYAQGGNMVVLDPTAKTSFSVYSTNHSSAKVRLYAVQPTDWKQFQEYYRRINYDDSNTKPKIPGRLISDKVVTIASKPDEMVETRIDLTQALTGGFGNVIVDVEPTIRRNKYDRTRIFTWVQSTQIGLDAFVDNQELVGWATDLKTGKPLNGVELSVYPNGGKVVSQETSVESENEGTIASWWNWLTTWGTSEDAIKETQTVDENGETTDVETIEAAQTNLTGDNGILRLALPDAASNQQNLLIAKKGKDLAFLPENTDYYWQEGGTWHKQAGTDYLRWFVFDDRGMYRPKEEVAVKGYIRKVTAGKLGDVVGLGDNASGLTYKVFDSQNNEIGKGTANLNAFGAFDFKFKLPDNANLGYARVELSTTSVLSGNTNQLGFQIQEFRRPEFEVSAKNETEAPYFVKESANVAVEAKYYAGGGLANADVNWTVRATPTNYTPPNRGDYTFGTWVPWWRNYDEGGYRGDYGGGNVQTFKGVTDAAGKHVLKIDFESVKPARPYSVSAAAAVQDVNRQTWSSTTNLLVHPSSVYVGLKMDRYFVQKGENINIETIAAGIDGNLIADKDIEIKAVLKDWAFDKGSWKEVNLDEQTCQVKSKLEAQKCVFVAKQGGRYTITAKVMDDRERLNETEITIWVAGGKTPPKRSVEQEEVQLIPNKKEYAPNDVAELLVMSPFPNAEGILTLRREGIVKTERFSIKDSSIVLRIPLEEKYLPNIYAQVDLVGAATRTNDAGEVDTKLAKRPAFATGNLNLAISTASRELTVSAEPLEKTLAPGSETKVNVQVKDFRGEPVANSEVAVVVVDESVLALSNYSIANPMSIFYTQRGMGVRDFHLRKDVLLGNPEDVKAPPPPPPAPEPVMAGAASNTAMMKPMATPSIQRNRAMRSEAKKEMAADMLMESERDDKTDSPDTPINLRQNFDALALFSPSVKTDSSGKATVNIKLPDNLTRYRITAISVDAGKRFGKSESNITAKQPLMVRPSAPRFMNFGDKIELPIVVQNQTDKDMTVDVAVRATNATLTDGGGKRVVIKANDRAEIRFPVATEKAGIARFQIATTSGSFADAAEISLPVWTPATTEAFATYGTTDQNGAIFQPVQTPGDVFPQFGGLEVTTSSTQLQELTDAFIYLQAYPFECSEQVSSRMISVAALQDVLKAFKAKEVPTEEALKKRFARDIEILQSRQNDNGYFGLWRRDGERYKYPFVTAHVAHSLVLAKAKGYKVPDEMLNKVKPYLKNIESHYDQWHKNPQVRWTISAYALYVRNLMGDNDAAKAKKLLAEATIQKMPFEALGWIMSVLVDSKNSTVEVENIKRFLMNRTTETAAAANFVTDYGDGAWVIMYSNRRADGVLLEAMLKADPNNDLVPKLVRGLLDHRTKGAWDNTQENVFILLALDKYFQAYEKVTPNFVTKVWLGNTYAGEQKFVGRSVDSNLLNIPMNYLVEQGGTSNLILDKQGAGRLYYRIGMKYAPKNLNLKPADYGFEVLRKYEAIDNADDVKQNADGSWTIKSGARVRVRLTMVAQARRYHVALVDNLPAGLEILNPELAVTEEIPADTQSSEVTTVGSRSFGDYYWWRRNWYEHQNFRDERAEAFASLLWEGAYNYSYVARATTPGKFVVPPAKAEEMYHPETFGRTGTDFVNVE